jgi:hypothetical protein
MTITASRRTRTTTSHEWTIPATADTPAPVIDVHDVVVAASAEVSQTPGASAVWMRPEADSIVVGYTVEAVNAPADSPADSEISA